VISKEVGGDLAMKRLMIAAAALLALSGEVHAQGFGGFNRGMGGGLAPGSTVQGDALRGEGVFLMGAGYYNLNTAMANSINTDTWMRLNEYIYQSIKLENHEKALHRAEVMAKRRENYEKILDRNKNSPEERDVERGAALNAKLEELLNPKIQESVFSLSPVVLDGDTVRSIPFFYGSEGTIISINRVTPGKKRPWPVALRGDNFAHERDAYLKALENTKELQNQSKLSREAIESLGKTIDTLKMRLFNVIRPSRDKDYVEAEQFLNRLEDWKNQLRKQEIEKIAGEIEKYHGTTIHDLVRFMGRNNLRFGVAKIGDENELYTSLYAKMKQQLESVANAGPGREN